MKKLTLVFLVFVAISGYGQFTYQIQSEPDSAIVFLNNNKECFTPCEVRFQWRQNEGGRIVLRAEKENFVGWSDTLFSKPRKFFFKKNI